MLKLAKIFRRFQLIFPPVSVLLCLLDTCRGYGQVDQVITVTVYEHPNYQGSSDNITVNRCENLWNFDDRTSSIRTSGCILLFTDTCCQGQIQFINRDIEDVGIFNFDDKITSISPCNSYQAPLPDVVQQYWPGGGATMHKIVEDGDISIYYDWHVSGKALEGLQEYLKRVWSYVKAYYGYFGREGRGGLVSAFIHFNVDGPSHSYSPYQNYFDITSSCRNIIDFFGSRDTLYANLTGLELDVITREISHIVEYASNRIHGSPTDLLWGRNPQGHDSKWAEIFIYDVYDALDMIEERDRVSRMWENSSENFPRPNTYWFRDWFLPIYERHGGVRVLNNYFRMLAYHYPRRENRWQYSDRTMNLGEFVHFFSGAAGWDLKSQARIAFAWDDAAERELAQAKIDFPNIEYK